MQVNSPARQSWPSGVTYVEASPHFELTSERNYRVVPALPAKPGQLSPSIGSSKQQRRDPSETMNMYMKWLFLPTAARAKRIEGRAARGLSEPLQQLFDVLNPCLRAIEVALLSDEPSIWGRQKAKSRV